MLRTHIRLIFRGQFLITPVLCQLGKEKQHKKTSETVELKPHIAWRLGH